VAKWSGEEISRGFKGGGGRPQVQQVVESAASAIGEGINWYAKSLSGISASIEKFANSWKPKSGSAGSIAEGVRRWLEQAENRSKANAAGLGEKELQTHPAFSRMNAGPILGGKSVSVEGAETLTADEIRAQMTAQGFEEEIYRGRPTGVYFDQQGREALPDVVLKKNKSGKR
jgi:hypothetical protein